jgi:hypothetical protein
LIALDHNVESISSIAMIGVNSLAPIAGLDCTLHRFWRIDTPPVAAASSDLHIHGGWRWRSRLHTGDLQLHAPASTTVKAPRAHLVAINIDVETISSIAVITIDADAPVPSI